MSHVASRRLSASRIFARLLIIAGCLALTVLLVFHQQVPDVAGLGLVIDNLAPGWGWVYRCCCSLPWPRAGAAPS